LWHEGKLVERTVNIETEELKETFEAFPMQTLLLDKIIKAGKKGMKLKERATQKCSWKEMRKNLDEMH